MDIGFIIKKMISAIVMPFPFALILLCIGFILLFYRKRLGLICQGLGLAVLLTISFQPFANWAIHQVEKPYAKLPTKSTYQTIVVLGSCHHSDHSLPLQAKFCGTGLYRLTEAIRLWKVNPDADFFVSGYEGENDTPYAFLARDFAIEQGVDKNKIKVFETPKDTRQEAEQMTPYLKGKSFALVTSASHMERSILWFKHYQLNPQPAPAHFFSRKQSAWEFSVSALMKTEFAWYQTLGLIWAKLIIAFSD